MNTGLKLRRLQKELGVSSVELAKRTGKSPQQISRWRSQGDMLLSSVVLVCSALNIPVSDFLK
ncbi:MAG: helix-turn-helix domain-containing protein [Alphaproteobacteria bacterium]